MKRNNSQKGCAHCRWHGGAFASACIGSLGLAFEGVIFEAFELQGNLFLVLGFSFLSILDWPVMMALSGE